MPPRHLPATRSWASPPRTPPPSLRTRRARTSSCWGGGDTLGTDRPASVGLTVSTRRGGQRSPDQTRSRGASGHRPQAEPRAGTGRQLRPVPWPRTQLRGRPPGAVCGPLRGQAPAQHSRRRPQTAVYEPGEFGETEDTPPQMHPPPPAILPTPSAFKPMWIPKEIESICFWFIYTELIKMQFCNI